MNISPPKKLVVEIGGCVWTIQNLWYHLFGASTSIYQLFWIFTRGSGADSNIYIPSVIKHWNIHHLVWLFSHEQMPIPCGISQQSLCLMTREGKSKLYHIFHIYTLIMVTYWYIPLESQKYPMVYHPFPNITENCHTMGRDIDNISPIFRLAIE